MSQNILTICSKQCYLLKCLSVKGLPVEQLYTVFCTIAVSRILHALPLWGTFLAAELWLKSTFSSAKQY